MLIINGKLITWGSENQILDEHWGLLISDGRIEKIAPQADLIREYPDEERLDAEGQYVMPGNICAHTHFYGAFSRGMGIPGDPPANFTQILEKLWWRLDKALDEDGVRYSALVCLVDAIKHGTTTLIDHHASPNAIEGSLDVIADLEDLGIYSLMPVYTHNFRSGFQNNAESVFEIQHLSAQDPFQGNVMNQWFAPQAENGYFFNVPTQSFVDAFEVIDNQVVDPRLDYTVGREGTTWFNGDPFLPSWSPTGFLQKKHLQPLSEIPVGTKGDGDLNYVFMRYAEVLLIKAEALNELNRSADALEPLNSVRQRARQSYLNDETLEGFGAIPDGLLPDIATTDKAQLRELIRNERRVELGFEFHRYYDLLRYGSSYAEQKLSDTNFSYDQHRYFPVPQNEVDINNQISN